MSGNGSTGAPELSGPGAADSKGPAVPGPGAVWARLAALVFLFLALLAVGLACGSVRIPLGAVVHGLLGHGSGDIMWDQILWQLRLPRCVTATMAGAALAVSGLL